MEKGESKVRVHFDFSKKALRQTNELKEQVGFADNATLLRNALRVYTQYVECVMQKGFSVIGVRKKDEKVIEVEHINIKL